MNKSKKRLTKLLAMVVLIIAGIMVMNLSAAKDVQASSGPLSAPTQAALEQRMSSG